MDILSFNYTLLSMVIEYKHLYVTPVIYSMMVNYHVGMHKKSKFCRTVLYSTAGESIGALKSDYCGQPN